MSDFNHNIREYQRGQANAQKDIAAGRLKIMILGYPASYVSIWLKILQKEYGIQLHNHGCRVSEDLRAYVKGYNEISEAEICRRFGADVLDRTRQEAQNFVIDSLDAERLSSAWMIPGLATGRLQWILAIVFPIMFTYISTWINLIDLFKPLSLLINLMCFLGFLVGVGAIGFMPYSLQNRILLYGLYIPLLLLILPGVILWVSCIHGGKCL